jgi:hypothetical protein
MPLYFSVKAVDAAGNKSEHSNTVDHWARPEVTTVDPSALERGGVGVIAVAGVNFSSGATVELSNPGVTISNVQVLSCQAIGFEYSVSMTADLGAFDLEVTNAEIPGEEGRIYGVAAGAMQVVPDATAPVKPTQLRRVFLKP